MNRVIDYAKSNGLKVVLDNDIISSFVDNSVTDEDVYNYLDALNVSNEKGEAMGMRDYQRDAVKTIIKRKRRLISSATSSGKSLVVYGACRYLIDVVFEKKDQVLVVVPTISLIKQMKGDMIDYSRLNGWAAYDLVTEYGGGKKNATGRVVVATYQSLYRKPPIVTGKQIGRAHV